ncbi:MAG: helix-turn-helix domain-containing protein [Firmicutes bacterium]|nr:helix-turn-helix domain-containing protein [Bacillota bacterium]
MILSEKLLTLRTRAGLSQEELAEKLDVSRQSISKWENGSSIPGIDKILEIAKLYGVSTDYLLKDELEELPDEVVADVYRPMPVREVSAEEANEYLAAIHAAAQRIALGVSLCILSPAAMLVLVGLYQLGHIFASEDIAGGVGCGVLLAIVAVAVVLFITNGMRLEEYDYLENEEFRLAYGVAGIVEKQERAFRPAYYRGIAFGAALCVLSCVPIVIAGAAQAPEGICTCMCALLLAVVALGVNVLVRVCIRWGGYNRLLQRGDYTPAKKRENNALEAFAGAYWAIVAGIYLAISFAYMNWHISWVIWPIASGVFALIRAIFSATRKQ